MSMGLMDVTFNNRGLFDPEIDSGGLFDRDFLSPLAPPPAFVPVSFVRMVDWTLRVPDLTNVALWVPEITDLEDGGLTIPDLIDLGVTV